MIAILIFIVLLFLSPLLRCSLCNIFSFLYYFIKDILLYFIKRRWQIWNGYGLHIFIGMFGKGKTLTMVHRAVKQYKRQKKFKGNEIHILSNVEIKGIPYTPLVSYQQIIDSPANTLILIDEVSTLFNSRMYKDFPMEMLFQMLQLRHNKKMLYATAQRFGHVDKLMRDITTTVIDCTKIWRFQCLKYYDAWDYENCTNRLLIKPSVKKWYFVFDKYYKQYDTNQFIKKDDFLSNSEVLEKRGEVFHDVYNAKLNRKGKKMLKG